MVGVMVLLRMLFRPWSVLIGGISISLRVRLSRRRVVVFDRLLVAFGTQLPIEGILSSTFGLLDSSVSLLGFFEVLDYGVKWFVTC